jgi:hypothetical protein
MQKSRARPKSPPKQVLALPDLEQAKTVVLNSLTSASAQRTYDHAIREFVAWYCSEPRLALNRTVVLRSAFTSNTKDTRRPPSTFAWPPSDELRTRLQTRASSVPNWRRGFAV